MATLLMAVNRRIHFLSRYGIPEPVTGGIVFVGFASLFSWFQAAASCWIRPCRDRCCWSFFATAGLDADWALLRRSGPWLLQFLLLLVPYVLVQNLVGPGMARVFDLPPAMGLLGGAVTLMGGFGTGAAYARQFIEQFNLQGAEDVAMTMTTFGLLAGGALAGASLPGAAYPASSE